MEILAQEPARPHIWRVVGGAVAAVGLVVLTWGPGGHASVPEAAPPPLPPAVAPFAHTPSPAPVLRPTVAVSPPRRSCRDTGERMETGRRTNPPSSPCRREWRHQIHQLLAAQAAGTIEPACRTTADATSAWIKRTGRHPC